MNSSKNQTSLVIISIILGIILGIFSNNITIIVANYFIKVFLSLMKFISIPIIFLSITSAISKLENSTAFKSIFGNTLKYTILTTLIAATIAMFIYQIYDPALVNHTMGLSSTKINNLDVGKYLLNIVPQNIIVIFYDNNILAIVSTALFLGIGTLFLEGNNKNEVRIFFTAFFELFIKIASFVIKLIPMVLWAFIVNFIEDIKSGFELKKLIYYILAIITANFLHAVIILPILLKSRGISPILTFRGMIPALITGFFSKSSSAALPSTMHCLEKNLGVNKQISSITVPLCTTINMNACAAFIYITVLFVAESNGMIFTKIDYISWIFLATIAAIGNAGVPMGCFFMASAYLVNMGVPTYLMGVILPFYAVLDMFETAINIWSDACVTSIINKKNSNCIN